MGLLKNNEKDIVMVNLSHAIMRGNNAIICNNQ